jgi:hypothetical protein
MGFAQPPQQAKAAANPALATGYQLGWTGMVRTLYQQMPRKSRAA